MVPHPSAPQCQGERLGRQRLCGKCLRIPCPDHQFPSFQSSSLGWWLSVVPPWSLPFLLKHKGERCSDIRKSQWGKKALKLFLWAEVLHRKCFFPRMCSCCHLVEHLYLYRHELLVQLEFACLQSFFFVHACYEQTTRQNVPTSVRDEFSAFSKITWLLPTIRPTSICQRSELGSILLMWKLAHYRKHKDSLVF